jgi:hypothetical protein
MSYHIQLDNLQILKHLLFRALYHRRAALIWCVGEVLAILFRLRAQGCYVELSMLRLASYYMTFRLARTLLQPPSQTANSRVVQKQTTPYVHIQLYAELLCNDSDNRLSSPDQRRGRHPSNQNSLQK